MRKYAFAITVSLLLIAGGFFAVFSEANAALPQNSYNSTMNLQPSPPPPPPHSVLVVNVLAKITNDIDSGYNGYWAIDYYTLHVQIWHASSNGSFYLVLTAEGTSTTYPGSPISWR